MVTLNRDQILSAQDLPREEVSVPEWGGSVYVRTMTGQERAEWEMSFVRVDAEGKKVVTPDAQKTARERLVALTVVDDGGERIFSEGDVGALSGKSALALDRLYDVAARLSGLTSPEQIAEDLEPARSGDG